MRKAVLCLTAILAPLVCIPEAAAQSRSVAMTIRVVVLRPAPVRRTITDIQPQRSTPGAQSVAVPRIQVVTINF